MSYAISEALQAAIFTRLAADPALTAEVGSHIYDALPAGPVPSLYVSLGPEKVRAASDASADGAWHDISVTVVTDAGGFRQAKRAAVALSDALEGADLTLARGRLTSLRFLRAEARHRSGGLRRIEMIFRARVDDDQSQ
ncbi:Protein of unknown function [Roseivivax halotolerans]|uniref:DUF3168 domain-containing protein n=1 Tax=Roseivivax halotolerans TaxID=93684 RepID=A0A1I5W6S9_9RHOB|nr:DUF3168 domain-containing protein [Roseivivax halotolerans]SFQ15327.1 Protein of unknown function [Roseivivax halotolerans]